MINIYEICLTNGIKFEVTCDPNDINRLIDLIDEMNIDYVEQL